MVEGCIKEKQHTKGANPYYIIAVSVCVCVCVCVCKSLCNVKSAIFPLSNIFGENKMISVKAVFAVRESRIRP